MTHRMKLWTRRQIKPNRRRIPRKTLKMLLLVEGWTIFVLKMLFIFSHVTSRHVTTGGRTIITAGFNNSQTVWGVREKSWGLIKCWQDVYQTPWPLTSDISRSIILYLLHQIRTFYFSPCIYKTIFIKKAPSLISRIPPGIFFHFCPHLPRLSSPESQTYN